MTATMKPYPEIYGWDTTPQIGWYIKPDSWTYGMRLEAGDSFSTFRLPLNSGGPIKSLAVEIEVTGRTFQRVNCMSRMVRVKITFPGDCEPDTITKGYMEIPWKYPRTSYT